MQTNHDSDGSYSFFFFFFFLIYLFFMVTTILSSVFFFKKVAVDPRNLQQYQLGRRSLKTVIAGPTTAMLFT